MIVVNGTEKPMLLILEPYAHEYQILPGQSVTVVGSSPDDFETVEKESDGLRIWAKCEMDVWLDGKILRPFHFKSTA